MPEVQFLLFFVGLYFLPTILAFGKGHHNRAAIACLNVLLGWTLLGWVVALVWAFTRVASGDRQAPAKYALPD